MAQSQQKRYSFLIDTNLGLSKCTPTWPEILDRLHMNAEDTTDLVYLDEKMEKKEPDFGFIPSADFHRMMRNKNTSYRGLAIPTSKVTGQTILPSVVVVRKDDPAEDLSDLRDATFGYINESCTSCYFAAGVMLAARGETLYGFLKPQRVEPWQGQIDAVVKGDVRVTIVPDDVWGSEGKNSETTRIIGRWDNAVPGCVVVRKDIDDAVADELLKELLRWQPPWENLYGPFKPFYLADVHRYFHELDSLPEGF